MIKNKNFNNIFNIWLITLIVFVSLIIFVGGLTRLTDSGLSITEWELFKGILPPLTSGEWSQYFESYKKIPQYLLLNNNMTLSEFKYIFLWEYAHRLLARFIGILFLIPFLFFLLMNIFSKDLIIKLSIIFILILAQGIMGWYMVSSGLIENTTVSHYRLSAHLFLAFSILSSLFWILLNSLNKSNFFFFNLNSCYNSLKLLLVFIFIQIILGAFVSGLDAGRIYQTWPFMNGSYFPDDTSFKNFFSFNQASTVQFIHRNIAYVIFFITLYVGYKIYKKSDTKLYKIFLLFFSIIIIQIILGIFVLVSGANIYFASMHQISSIFLTLIALKLYHRSIGT
jgi:cytochrome c oxidase assembly protein subunit 15|tara:strand:+ start:53 stop:1069 length:1017 start_codon:yes stop_codon:yes gene_type:complete